MTIRLRRKLPPIWTNARSASQFVVVATAKQGVDLRTVRSAMDEELARFLKDGPTARELDRIKTQSYAGFVRGIERIGGFGGKSDILATSQTYLGHAARLQERLAEPGRGNRALICVRLRKRGCLMACTRLRYVRFPRSARLFKQMLTAGSIPSSGPARTEAAALARRPAHRTVCACWWRSGTKFRS